MGVCEGVPGSIMPDHMGRADYHGASVNQAARFMDAGEEGGGSVWATGMTNEVSIDQAARFMAADEGKGEPVGQLQRGQHHPGRNSRKIHGCR